ncbi:ricin-type beta-trefoil lectin domain protein [Kitasatospora aureofaciens]|uniref:RICIN domain-containing protein n=1 Tax=Kitasatospora aureofaciens TaxID=1894 RepID=UPI0034025DC1
MANRKGIAKIAAVAAAPLLAATLGTGTAHADSGSVWGEIRFANGYCLDVSGGNFVDGATVQLWGCNGTNAQQWLLGPQSPGHFWVQAAESDNGHLLCLNNWEGGDVTGNHMRLHPCSKGSGNDQQFNWVYTGNGKQLQPKVASNNCVDAWGGLYQGAEARLYRCTDAAGENIISNPPL